MSALGPLFQCSTSLMGAPGCGRYFARGDYRRSVDVPAGVEVEVYTVGGWRCSACRERPGYVRIVPVTPAAFELAAARDGAPPIEVLEVDANDQPLSYGGYEWAIVYRGLRQPAGHYLVRDTFIAENQSGKYVLNFRRREKLSSFGSFFSAGLALPVPRVDAFYGVNL